MKPFHLFTDVKIWILLGIVLGLAFGFESPDTSTLLTVVLIIQMTFTLEGLKIDSNEVRRSSGSALVSIILCYLLNSGLIIVAGLFFIDSVDLWYGWVMLAATPCAMSVMVCSLIMGGDARMTAIAVTAIYVVALVLAPVITLVFIGEAADTLMVLRYIVLFIVVPFIIRIPLSKLHPPPMFKMTVINIMMFLLVLIGIGTNREYMTSQPELVFWLIIACIFRTFVVHILLMYAFKRAGMEREKAMSYGPMAVWKNSGMSIAMVIMMFGATHPGAVLPCVVSLAVECAWFACASRYTTSIWPYGSKAT